MAESDLNVRWVRLDETEEALKPLIAAQFEEVCPLYGEIGVEVDWMLWREQEKIGTFRGIGVFCGEDLEGYLIAFVFPHWHHAGQLHALVDLFWVSPRARYRGAGKTALRMFEEQMTREGVQMLGATERVGQGLDKLFAGLGWRPTEVVYTKKLGS